METCKNCPSCKHYLPSEEDFRGYLPRRCKNGHSDVMREWFKINEHLAEVDQKKLDCWEEPEKP